jgi:hypothetical protein
MQIQYNPDEIVALDARKFTLRTALKGLPDQIGPMAALWRDLGLEPSFYNAEHIIRLRTLMALEEYAMALRALASAGRDATTEHRGELYSADIQLERFGLRNDPKRIAIMEAIWSAAGSRPFAEMEVTNDTEVFYAVDGGPWRGTPAAIRAKGLDIDTNLGSQGFCPHQWLKDGFVDPELASKYPYPHQARRAS